MAAQGERLHLRTFEAPALRDELRATELGDRLVAIAGSPTLTTMDRAEALLGPNLGGAPKGDEAHDLHPSGEHEVVRLRGDRLCRERDRLL